MAPAVSINSSEWAQGFRDAYHQRGGAPGDGSLSYFSGRVEGEALREKHQHEFEEKLFDGVRVRPVQP